MVSGMLSAAWRLVLLTTVGGWNNYDRKAQTHRADRASGDSGLGWWGIAGLGTARFRFWPCRTPCADHTHTRSTPISNGNRNASPTRTPTSAGRPYIEALQESTNVRAGPDINENRVGQIFPGTTYPILGKRFQWYWIEFPESPAGTAWVHESVVRIGGDITQIQDIELESIPTIDPVTLAVQQTAEAIINTPGAVATLTAQAQITPIGVFTPGAAGPTLAPGQPLPTFTFPPYTVTPIPIPRTNPPPANSSGIAPIVPILALAALGLMGLLVSLLRRM